MYITYKWLNMITTAYHVQYGGEERVHDITSKTSIVAVTDSQRSEVH